jgi:hypothetical protein
MIQNIIVSILCGIFTAIPIFKLFQVKNNIKKCWPMIKCTPVGQLLFPVFGPKNISATQNQHICDSSKFSAMFDAKIANVNNDVNILNNTVASINNDVNGVKTNIYNLQVKAINDLKKVARAFSKMYQRIGNLGIVIFSTIKNLLNIFKYLLQIGQVSYYTVKSIWDGPIGNIGKTFGGIF